MDKPATVTPAPALPEKKKNSPWSWIIGGCVLIILIAVGSMATLGWWGARKVKKEMQKYTPSAERMKENLDRMNEEAAEWEKKSQELRETMPDPEDLQNQLPADSGVYPQ